MEDYNKLLTDFYLKYNPEKLSEVPGLLNKYKGQEEELLIRLREKYKVNQEMVEEEKHVDKSQIINENDVVEADITKPPKNNKKLYIIVGIIALLVIAASIAGIKLSNVSSKDVKIIDYSNLIRQFIQTEDRRNFEEIYSYFSPEFSRYYDIKNPNYSILKSRYEDVWGFTTNPKNLVKTIEKINDYTYDVQTNFTCYNQRKKKEINVNSTLRFLFDSNGKIIEIYSVELKNNGPVQ
jgi:hypothetical protein